MWNDMEEFCQIWDRESVMDTANSYIRYAEESRPDLAVSDNEECSNAGVCTEENSPNQGALDGSLSEFRQGGIAESGLEICRVEAITSDLETYDSVVMDDYGERSGMVLRPCASHPFSTASVFSSLRPRVSSQGGQYMGGDRRSSLHLNTLLSATSDRTMVDHGHSVDQVRVQTPDYKRGACKGLVKAYLSQSAKGHRYQTSWSEVQQRRSWARKSHDTNNSSSSTSRKRSVTGDSSGGVYGGRRSGAEIFNGGRRSMSCPAIRARAFASCARNKDEVRAFSFCLGEQRSIPLANLTLAGNKVGPKPYTEGIAQYRLAVLNAKKARYGFSIREILANQNEVDEEEQEEGVGVLEN